MTAEEEPWDAGERARVSRIARGLPPTITDPAILARVAHLLRQPLAPLASRDLRERANGELRRLPPPESRRMAIDLLLEPPEWARTWRVSHLLWAINGVGDVRVKHGLALAGIEADTQIGQLDAGTRTILVGWLREGAPPGT